MNDLFRTLRSSIRMQAFYYWIAFGITVILFLFLKKEKFEKRVSIAVLVGYLFLVLGTTVFRRRTLSVFQYRLEVFRYVRYVLKNGIRKSKYMVSQMVWNILMLTPIGFLMPTFVKKKRWVILSGFLFSLLIETLQLVLRRGCFELDDLFHNTLGVALACGCVKVAEILIKKVFSRYRDYSADP